ncbi:hypothetical protein POTOM_011342 [Populus tomentosa]|uniref:Uncharacterized protein n=1 Tax=Populus tomentosa TaxID=118781 RepID=A0A8X8CZR6_POPTO|nr:hypothetical protein POTOM_011342 [Populus tomentosa]
MGEPPLSASTERAALAVDMLCPSNLQHRPSPETETHMSQVHRRGFRMEVRSVLAMRGTGGGCAPKGGCRLIPRTVEDDIDHWEMITIQSDSCGIFEC